MAKYDLNNITLPFVVKNVTLFVPGEHNGVNYSRDSIENAFKSTNWEDKRVRSLYRDHNDDWAIDPMKPWNGKSVNIGASVENYIGSVKNVHMDMGKIVGDIYIVDRNVATKLAFDDCQFAISPSGSFRGGRNTAREFVIRNFAMVVNPAQKQAYINPFENQSAFQVGWFNFAMSSESDSGISEVEWGSVDKSTLPASSFAYVGDKDLKSTWKLPYKTADGKINVGAVKAAYAAIMGARGGVKGIDNDAKNKILNARKMLIEKGYIKGENEMEIEELKQEISEVVKGNIQPLNDRVTALAGDIEKFKEKEKAEEEKEKKDAEDEIKKINEEMKVKLQSLEQELLTYKDKEKAAADEEAKKKEEEEKSKLLPPEEGEKKLSRSESGREFMKFLSEVGVGI